MNWFSAFLTSSIGRKIVMGITGLSLIAFLLVHCGINACIFLNDGGETFNEAAHFMGSNFFIRASEIGLFLGIIIHAVQGLVLWADQRKRRPVSYEVNAGNATSTWYSRSMGLLGTIILLFLIIHLYHFWVPSRITGLEEYVVNGVTYHNLYGEMQMVFENPFVVIIYVLAVISLAYHLLHGFQSAFQTMGWNHKKYTPFIKAIGVGYSIIISVMFAAMPIAMYFKIIK